MIILIAKEKNCSSSSVRTYESENGLYISHGVYSSTERWHVRFWQIRHSIFDAEIHIGMDAPEYKVIKDFLKPKKVDEKALEIYVAKLVIKHSSVEDIFLEIENIKRKAFQEGEESKINDIRKAARSLGFSI